MSILDEALTLVRQRLGRDLNDLRVERLAVGLFFTGVKLNNGAAGICFTPVKDIPQAVCCPSSAGRIFDPVKAAGMPAEEMAAAAVSAEPIKAAAGLAALNALSAVCWDRGLTDGYAIKRRLDAQDAVRMPAGASVAVVGALVPTLRALRARGGEWWVIELDPRTLKGEELDHFVPAAEAGEIYRRAEVLIITGTTLVTHTLDAILAQARPDAEIAVLGPTASLLPEPLFKRGVRVGGGVWVTRPDELLDVLAGGGSGYHFFDRLADRVVIERPD